MGRNNFWILLFYFVTSFAGCAGSSKGKPDTLKATNEDSSFEGYDTGNILGSSKQERDLNIYCAKVQEISDKQAENEKKLEKILLLIEEGRLSLKPEKRKELQQDWNSLAKEPSEDSKNESSDFLIPD
jgi:hypothetical protein